MYYKNRAEAGKLLLEELMKYRYEDCAVVALDDGGVLVGEQIAAGLHCILNLLVSEQIDVPGEGLSFGSVSQSGQFTYNSDFSDGQKEGYTTEFHGYLEEKKREAFQHINRLIGDGGTIDVEMLKGRNIILVSDGLKDGAVLDVALEFLKPIYYQRLIVASPISSVPAIDKVHILANEVHVLDVKENYMSTDHYYDENDIPSHEDTVKKINNIIINWQ
jgi:hypothetical protein